MATSRPASGGASGAPAIPMVPPRGVPAMSPSETCTVANADDGIASLALVTLSTGYSVPLLLTYRAPTSLTTTSFPSSQPLGRVGLRYPQASDPTTSRAVSSPPARTPRSGLVGSSSCPPGAPLMKAVSSRRRL